MKKIILLAVALVCASQGFAQTKDYASFEAKIANLDGAIYLSIKDKVVKKITKNTDGIYKDTIKVKQGGYKLFDGKQYTPLFLANGYDLKLTMDANNKDQTIVFSGEGADVNNYYAQFGILFGKIDFKDFFLLDEINFRNKMEMLKKNDLEILDKYILDAKKNAEMKASIIKKHDIMQDVFIKNKEKLADKIASQKAERDQKNAELNKMNGTTAPNFNYINHKGDKTKLKDFDGKYVYIDLWATWCGPCRGEIPYLQKIEEKYHDKNIVFVSISIDKEVDFEKWKTFVKEKNMGGVQLFADNAWESAFAQSFGVKSIPRFILIGPDRKVIQAVAPRPSDPELVKDLDLLLK